MAVAFISLGAIRVNIYFSCLLRKRDFIAYMVSYISRLIILFRDYFSSNNQVVLYPLSGSLQ